MLGEPFVDELTNTLSPMFPTDDTRDGIVHSTCKTRDLWARRYLT